MPLVSITETRIRCQARTRYVTLREWNGTTEAQIKNIHLTFFVRNNLCKLITSLPLIGLAVKSRNTFEVLSTAYRIRCAMSRFCYEPFVIAISMRPVFQFFPFPYSHNCITFATQVSRKAECSIYPVQCQCPLKLPLSNICLGGRLPGRLADVNIWVIQMVGRYRYVCFPAVARRVSVLWKGCLRVQACCQMPVFSRTLDCQGSVHHAGMQRLRALEVHVRVAAEGGLHARVHVALFSAHHHACTLQYIIISIHLITFDISNNAMCKLEKCLQIYHSRIL